MLWLVCALTVSLTGAVCAEINRLKKLDPVRLNFWQKILSGLVMLPALLLPWPDSPAFYMVAVLNGLVMAWLGIVQLSLAARHNGRVASMFMPVKIFVAFLLWLALDAPTRTALLAMPINSMLVVFCLCVALAALARIRRNDAGWAAFVAIAPAGLALGVADVLVKLILSEEALFQQALLFAALATLSSILASSLWLVHDGKEIAASDGRALSWRELLSVDKNMLGVAFMIAVLGNVAFIAFLGGLALAPNPAYVSAVALLVPVWLMIYHRARFIPDEGAPWAGFVMVLSAIFLVLAG